MKITLLTAYYYPEITAATHLMSDLAEDFAEYGADVTVITNFPTRGLDQNTREEYCNRRDEKLKNNLRVVRVGTRGDEGKNFIARAFKYGLNVLSMYKTAKNTKTDVFLISSTPPFLGIAGAFLSRKAPTVYNLQDVFPDSLINAGKANKNSLIVRICRKIEKYIYTKQNHIITISRDFRRLLLDRGTSENKISVVYNWIDETKVNEIPREKNILLKKYSLDKTKFYFTYCGNIGHSQNLEMIVDIAKEVEKDFPEIEFIFIGDGAWKTNLEQYIKKVLPKNVTLLPFQPYEDISHVMSLGDVSLVCSKANVGKSSFPSKTWSIMSASRPVICSFDTNSELCEIIRVADCGLNVPPDDMEALKEAILYAYQHPDEMKQFGKRGRKYIEDNLTRKNATYQYFKILKELND